VLEDELGDGAFTQRSSRPHRPRPPFRFRQLTRHQRHKFPLHGPREKRNSSGHFQEESQILDALAARLVQQPLLFIQRGQQRRRRLNLFIAASASAATATATATATAAATAAAAGIGCFSAVRKELQQGCVDRKVFSFDAHARLVEGTLSPVQFAKAAPAESVSTGEADGLS